MCSSMMSKALCDNGHEQLSKRGCNRYTPIVVHICRVTATLVKGRNASISPCLGCFLADGTVRQKVGKGLIVLTP